MSQNVICGPRRFRSLKFGPRALTACRTLLYFILINMGKGSQLHEVTKLYEDKFARRANFHQGTKLHEDNFVLRVNFARVTIRVVQK